MTREQWIDSFERAREQYACGLIDEDRFASRLRNLGFSEREIDGEIDELAECRDVTP